MKLPIDIVKPFGPSILSTKCPSDILDEINKWHEDAIKDQKLGKMYSHSKGNVPNLLMRDIEVIYYPEYFLKEIGFTDFIEDLGNIFLDSCQPSLPIRKSCKVSILDLPVNESDFPLGDELMCDVWSNSYYSGDYTPMHEHGSSLAGVLFLKIPSSLHEELGPFSDDKPASEHEIRLNGRLQFVETSARPFSDNSWTPDLTEGNLYIFPAWLGHVVYPMKCNDERRTLSFNIIGDYEYERRLNNFNHRNELRR